MTQNLHRKLKFTITSILEICMQLGENENYEISTSTKVNKEKRF